MAATPDTSDKTKAFVGNLSFKITEADLVKHFSEVTDGVLSANIITRGPRSLGYGFVEFSSLASAEKAVAAMNKKEIDDRAINVEIAKPRVPRAEGEAPAPREGGRRPRRRNNNSNKTSSASSSSSSTSSPSPASSSNNKNTSGRRRQNNNNKEKTETKDEDKVSSKSTLFIANLPFGVDDEKLKAIFVEAGQNPTVARVVMRGNRSKGFGFAEFATEAEQIAALASINGKEIDQRALIAKIAFDVPAADATPAASS